ncbi:acetoacetyl-CoA synthase [Aspergillus nomiae NRRL 13137]|uniref:Acetoacetyl-CoA synthase n=1 Tax=Aspergillus nomiae NRRL (strain ATCC 15546 / NRRL 13137 / CBS 260.88 / M93) TaxID=1509407 RepID=A0A0L1J8Z8_ASPN3|nr:acetoacetyl-CoA synthase [Aspergillus nomiae NRRL 13137]KNG88197.1 acetoacetyl-CoA synthase [Aspergillus nomiae NRRL 13137]
MTSPSSALPRKLWEHANPQSTEMWAFKQKLEAEKGLQLPTFHDLYQWSIHNRAAFWAFCWDYFPIIHEGSYTTVVDESARIDSVPTWFEGIRLNFAENMLFADPRGWLGASDQHHLARAATANGAVNPGLEGSGGSQGRSGGGGGEQQYRYTGYTAGDDGARGAVLVASTDTGVKGILDRLLQLQPKWVFIDDAAVYNGKRIDLRPKIRDIVGGLGGVEEFRGVVAVPRFAEPADLTGVPKTQSLATFLAQARSDELEFVRIGFRDPFLVVYSSGTTGKPKPIVHGVGGYILNGTKEARLHRVHSPESVVLQYTTTGWIMYLSAITGLMFGGKPILYDGSPFLPDVKFLIRLLGEYKVTHFGTSPRYLQELRKNNVRPREIADLSNLSIVTSTGMVLSESLFEWFYDEGFPAHTQLANISGGTDLAACFGLENPLTPLYVGGCQGPSLGLPIAAFDQADEGASGVKGTAVPDGVPGELVATAAFPTMPVKFLGADGPQKYFDSYFARFDNVWTHGDFISIHPITKQIFFLGRSDGVLNPSGIRFGSAEIYNVIDTRFADEIADSICVGQRRPQDTDESVMLFLLMRPGREFTPQLVGRVKEAIRKALSARHVPKYVFQTPEIPTTVNLKKVELPVKQIVSGKKIKPSGTLLNAKSLDFYYQFAEVERLVEPKSKL